jgi:hypothetical protein
MKAEGTDCYMTLAISCAVMGACCVLSCLGFWENILSDPRNFKLHLEEHADNTNKTE